MPAHRFALVIGLAVAGGLAVLGAVAWALAGTAEVLAFFGLWGGVTAGVALVLASLLRRRPGGDDGGGPGGPGGSPDPGPDEDPPWWPEFERALRAWEDGRRARV